MKVMKEYAEALYYLACEENMKEEIASAVDKVDQIFKDNPQYVELLSSSAIEIKERIVMLEKAFSSFVPEYVVSFLKLLCENGYIKYFEECAQEFSKLVDFSNKVVTAKVKTALTLTEEEEKALINKLEKMCARTVELDISVDKNILGGIIIEVDGKIIDASLSSQLKDMKEVIAK